MLSRWTKLSVLSPLLFFSIMFLLKRSVKLPSPVRRYYSCSTMTAPQHFNLDPKIWNPALYSSVHEYWFKGLEPNAKIQNDTTKKRWWGMGRSAEDLKVMDGEVRELFGSAIISIGPERLALPKFESYATEGDIARPFVEEVKQAGDGKAQADRLLALILLLDQFPRHLFREQEELKLVYTHYDRLAWSLFRAFKKANTSASAESPIADSWYRAHPVRTAWFYMPLMHAEDLVSQEEAFAACNSWQEEAGKNGEEDVVADLKANEGAAKSHLEIVERFGRFPHRNEALGRENTKEEEEWLKTGETFGVKQSGKE